MKQPVKKKEFKRPDTNSIREQLGMAVKTEADYVKSAAEKPMEFIPLPEAFADAIKLPGIPMGYFSIVTGWSNTGKSTIKNCLIASCINHGILPVIYETENNFDFQYAIDCGMKATPVYGNVEVEDVDPETGEVTYHTENRIVNYDGDFLYFDNKILAEMYGDIDYITKKQLKVKRKVAVIEDIAYSINTILDMQDAGNIQQPICFIWDSVGSIGSYTSYAHKVGNNMDDAGSIERAFRNITNNRIPASKKISEPYTNTFFCVNKVWNNIMGSMGGVPSIKLKGGVAFSYAARLIIHLGGMGSASTKKLEATAKGNKYQYGITTKIRTLKNQLPTPWNITYEGEMSCVHNGLLNPSYLEDYKKTYVKDIVARLEESSGDNELQVSDVEFIEEDTVD